MQIWNECFQFWNNDRKLSRVAPSTVAPARRSPPTARVAHVLAALTESAPEALSLAAVARHARLSASTCLGILTELAAAEWVVRRDPGPTYSLGPAAVVVGQAAQRSHAGLAEARRQLATVAEDLGGLCTVAGVVDAHIVVLDRAGHDPSAPLVATGTRYPFAAPIGVMFAAWHDDAYVRAWIERATIDLDRRRVARTLDVVASCRTLGWMAERLTDAERTLHELLPLAGDDPNDAVWRAVARAAELFGDRDYVLEEIEASARCSVSVVTAPAFDAEGRPDLWLSAYVMHPSVPTRRVRAIGERLRAAADHVSASVGGRDPWKRSA